MIKEHEARFRCSAFAEAMNREDRSVILALDIGNSNTVAGIFSADDPDENQVPCNWRTVTQRNRTSDELGIFLLGVLAFAKIEPDRIGGFIYSSVVPSFNPIVERMAKDYFGCDPIRVRSDMDLPIEILYPRPYEIGADRLVNAVGVSVLYGGNAIIIDLGTATTFCIVHDGKDYLGGIIGPGLKLSMEALSRNTAQLPPIEFSRPESVIGFSTVEALQSGFFYGWVGLIREILNQIRKENPDRDYRVYATGGLSGMIHQNEKGLFDVVDVSLTLRGLKAIYHHLHR